MSFGVQEFSTFTFSNTNDTLPIYPKTLVIEVQVYEEALKQDSYIFPSTLVIEVSGEQPIIKNLTPPNLQWWDSCKVSTEWTNETKVVNTVKPCQSQ